MLTEIGNASLVIASDSGEGVLIFNLSSEVTGCSSSAFNDTVPISFGTSSSIGGEGCV